MNMFIGYLLLINIIGLMIMYVDKKKAIKRQYRIPEKYLWGIAIIGGAVGCFAGMNLFRHKTKHWSFRIGFPVLALLQCVFLAKWLIS